MNVVDLKLLTAFIPVFFLVSLTPGMCMTLALTLGIAIGFRKTLWMMVGELVGVALVATFAAIGVATIMIKLPLVFIMLKIFGGCYLIYLGCLQWLSKGKMAIDINKPQLDIDRKSLIIQGFTTAVSNPKGWAFFISLLPPFINPNYHLTSQLIILITIILMLETSCLMIYALGGSILRIYLLNARHVRLLNKVSAIMMFGVGIWLWFS